MSLILSWKNKTSGEISTARFDVVTNESIEQIMTITSHPVEEGAEVADHARPENAKITIEGYVSNKPLYHNPGVVNLMSYTSTTLNVKRVVRGSRPRRVRLNIPTPPLKPNVAALVTAGISALGNALKGGTYAELAAEEKAQGAIRATLFRSNGAFPDRAKAMYEVLSQLQLSKTLLTATIKMAELDNMMIERLHVPRTVEDGNGASFQLDLQRIRVVKSETVSAPLPAEARGALLNAAGSKNAKDNKDDAKAKEQLQSLLSVGFEGAGAGLQGALNLLR